MISCFRNVGDNAKVSGNEIGGRVDVIGGGIKE